MYVGVCVCVCVTVSEFDVGPQTRHEMGTSERDAVALRCVLTLYKHSH